MSMSDSPYIIPPPGDDMGELMRWEHTRMVRRMMDGAWEQDLQNRVAREVGRERADAWGIAKTTCMPLVSIARETAALYLTEPEVRVLDTPIYGPFAQAIQASGLWPRMPRFQAMTIALRECAWRVSVLPTGEIQYRPVYPDMLIMEGSPDQPDQPVEVKELRYRDDWGWCWDHICIEPDEPENPIYRVEQVSTGADISLEVLGGDFSGPAYPYRRSDGTPILPYVLYHAESLGDRIWNWRGNWETVQACLDLGVNYTFLGHVLRDASFPQRYTLDCGFVGAIPAGSDSFSQRVEVIADPAVIMRAESTQEGRQPLIGQFQAGADPAALEGVISSLANRIAIDAGLPPADIQRMGGTARSGYAIALSNEGKRAAARRYAPIFRRADELLMSVTATLFNRATGSTLPEYGYQIVYRDLPLSPEELQARRANVIELMNAGLLSRVRAYQELNPGLTEASASAELARIDADKVIAATAVVDALNPANADATAPAPVVPEAVRPNIALTSTDVAGIVTVNEARAAQGLPPMAGPEGALTVSEYQARNAATIAAAANATSGTV